MGIIVQKNPEHFYKVADKVKYYLGLDLGGTNITAGVVDEQYNIIARESIPAGAGRSIEEVTQDMADISRRAAEKAGVKMSHFTSWGIGMPSCVNPKTRTVVHINNFGWKDVPMFDHLEKHFDLPVFIENDANCAAYGEILAGAARDYNNAVMLTLGTGVGGGVIINKKIYTGCDSMGCELGHTKLVFNGVKCTCGQRGCLESYCSATALIRRTLKKIKREPNSLLAKMCENDPAKVDGALVFEAAKRGDSAAAELVRDYVEFLSAGISTFIVIFRPDVVIIGGGISNAGAYLLDPLNERICENTFAAEVIGVPKAIGAKLGNDAGIIGAAFLERNV